jgi:hypothetical protein
MLRPFAFWGRVVAGKAAVVGRMRRVARRCDQGAAKIREQAGPGAGRGDCIAPLNLVGRGKARGIFVALLWFSGAMESPLVAFL